MVPIVEAEEMEEESMLAKAGGAESQA